jgi:hypothetical protein
MDEKYSSNNLVKTIITLYMFPEIWEPLTPEPKGYVAHLEILRFACMANEVTGDKFGYDPDLKAPNGEWWPYDANPLISKFAESKSPTTLQLPATGVVNLIKRLQRLSVVAGDYPMCTVALLEVCS